MKALVSLAPGGPETLVLADMPDPAPPASDELLLRVKACGVNYPDVLIIEDKYQFRPQRPFAPGCEVSGIVETVGNGVLDFKPGDPVIAYPGWGGMAEKLVVPVKRCIHMPREMSFEDAAGLLIVYGTTYHALRNRANLQVGETMLVLGASGGVGLAAVQMGKAWGARVIAAASSEEKLAITRDHGADVGLIYPSHPMSKESSKAFTEAIKEAAGPNGVNVVYDPVGGDYAESALRAMAWKGRYLVIGFVAGIPRIPLNLVLLKGCDILGVFWGSFADREPAANTVNLSDLMDLYKRGAIRPVISARFSLPRGGEALASMAARKVGGKAIVIVD
jgi:NADPH:quinone reductase